ncbi:MAG: UDP-N-acetylmuramoyl-tripeptide--D-alanyl-D-alanine ligase [Deltaproteobacteria bacterium]
MLSLKVSEIVEATNGKLLNGNPEVEIKNISTDTRKIISGDLFIPLVGDNFDGHDFIAKALEGSICGYLTSREPNIVSDAVIIKVDDTLKALQDIAGYYRDKFNVPIIGVTGSVGKTSTKEMIFNVLSKKFNVLKTQGNFNNHVGLPLTLLNLSKEHQAAVVEMGMSGMGEISTLSKIAKPHIAVITNIGLAHIGKLGSKQNILKAKAEIFDGMDEDGIAVLNADDSMLLELRNFINRNITYVGLFEEAELKAYNIKVDESLNTNFNIKIKDKEYLFKISVPGMHNVYNALAAIAIGLRFRIPVEQMIDAIESYKPEKMRMNIVKLNNNIKVLNDTYNANPNSMEEALKVMHQMPGARKIAVLGDMLELGEWTRQAHLDIGKNVVKNGINHLVTLGENSRFIAEGAAMLGMSQRKISTCNNIEEANAYLSKLVREGDVILVKGSRGMKMEGIVDFITEEVQICKSK